MTGYKGCAAIGVVVALMAGCAPPANPPATAAGPGAFDGTYSGPVTLTRNADCQCGDAVIHRTLTVAGGHARIVYNPGRGRAAAGTVRPDGSFTLVGETVTSVQIRGRLEGNALTGTFNSDTCSYDIALRKVA